MFVPICMPQEREDTPTNNPLNHPKPSPAEQKVPINPLKKQKLHNDSLISSSSCSS